MRIIRRSHHLWHYYAIAFCTIFVLGTLLNSRTFVFRNGHSSVSHPQCHPDPSLRPSSLRQLPADEKYLFYAPHSGFNNQVGELKNALLIAGLLNRTLILPPIFDHHAVVLGSCPKLRVRKPHEMRSSAWAHIFELIDSGRYIAIADVIDLSAVVSSKLVKTIDFRIFASLWCGADVTRACLGPLCHMAVRGTLPWGTVENCRALMSMPEETHRNCVYAVNDDCTTTIWMHGLEASHIPQVNITVSSGRKGKVSIKKTYKDIVEVLGPGSVAAGSALLSFGSLFSSEYKGSQLHVDFHSSMDKTSMVIKEQLKVMPFTLAIRNAGKWYAEVKIRQPFFCAQLRLLDGQFKNHWEKTFEGLKSELQVALERQQSDAVLPIFIMTDLPPSNWTGTYLGYLAASKSSYRLHLVEKEKTLLLKAAEHLMKEDYGLQSGFVSGKILHHVSLPSWEHLGFVPDILLYIQEVVCSCATLGFVGTLGSTITTNILELREANFCSSM